MLKGRTKELMFATILGLIGFIIYECEIYSNLDLEDWFMWVLLSAGIILSLGIVVLSAYIGKFRWYKKLIIKKYNKKEILISFDAFDMNLDKFSISKQATIHHYSNTDNQDVVFQAIMEDGMELYFKIGLFYKTMTLCDKFGSSYNFTKIQISPNNTKTRLLHQELDAFKRSIPKLIKGCGNKITDSWSIDPYSFTGQITN